VVTPEVVENSVVPEITILSEKKTA
jgi:hypothetical protein